MFFKMFMMVSVLYLRLGGWYFRKYRYVMGRKRDGKEVIKVIEKGVVIFIGIYVDLIFYISIIGKIIFNFLIIIFK